VPLVERQHEESFPPPTKIQSTDWTIGDIHPGYIIDKIHTSGDDRTKQESLAGFSAFSRDTNFDGRVIRVDGPLPSAAFDYANVASLLGLYKATQRTWRAEKLSHFHFSTVLRIVSRTHGSFLDKFYKFINLLDKFI